MKCLILAAGYATRLYPLTENFPKPLLKVGERTILDWLVDDIDTCGAVDEYIVISNHRFAHHFEAWAATKPQRITILDDGTETNETRLGAVRDIELAIEASSKSQSSLYPPQSPRSRGAETPKGKDLKSALLQEGAGEAFLVIAGDNVLDFSLTHFIRYAQEKGTSCIMRYYEPCESKLLKCGVVTIDADDRVLRMTEKSPTPETHWACPPFYYYTASDAQRVGQGIAAGCGTDAPGSFMAWLCEQTPVYAMEMPGRRYDIGNLQSYEEVQRTYKGIENSNH
jgi:glucose-1-phosphate thymidylyltransferase